jgi:hypothetical protein
MNRKPKQLPKQPFFARFLENQALDNVTGSDGGVTVNRTLKFPSDNDEHGDDR